MRKNRSPGAAEERARLLERGIRPRSTAADVLSGSRARDEAQRRRHSRLRDVRELRGRANAWTHGAGPRASRPGRSPRAPAREARRSTAFLDGEIGAVARPLHCAGDGVAGNRVQAVYAYAADGVDNYDEIAPFIRLWAGVVDAVFNDSAAETGGVRHVRFVSGPGCTLDVAKVALSPAGIASLGGTAAELAAQGFDRPDRKYLVWVDAYRFCGLATVKRDDRPSPDNANNGDGEPGMVARIDRGCWGRVNPSIEAHELVHLLGGAQPSAPNANDNFHCTDDADVLCYDDDGVLDGLVWAQGRQVPLRSVCGLAHERLLDCRHDDYFHTDPPANSYLADHWNVAASSFLTADGPAAVPDTKAPRTTGPRPKVVGATRRRSRAGEVALVLAGHGHSRLLALEAGRRAPVEVRASAQPVR